MKLCVQTLLFLSYICAEIYMDKKAYIYAKMAFKLDQENLDALEIYLYLALRLDAFSHLSELTEKLDDGRKNAIYLKIIIAKKNDQKDQLPALLKQYLACL